MNKKHLYTLTPLALALAMMGVADAQASLVEKLTNAVTPTKNAVTTVNLVAGFTFMDGTPVLTIINRAATPKDPKSPFAEELVNQPVINADITAEWHLNKALGWQAVFPLGLQPNQTLTIDLSAVATKPGIKLKSTTITVTTPAPSVYSLYSYAVTNPNADGENYVMTDLDTTMPVPEADRKRFEEAVTLKGLPAPRYIWSKSGKNLQVVQSLPKNFGEQKLAYQNAKALPWENADKKKALQPFTTPSNPDLLGLSGSDIQRVFAGTNKTALEWPLLTNVIVPESLWSTHAKVFKLPKKFNPDVALDTNWVTMGTITPDVLAKSTPIPFTVRVNPSEPLQPRLIIDDSLVNPEDFLVVVMEKPIAPYDAKNWHAPQWVKKVPAPKKQLHILEPGELVTMGQSHLLHLFHYGLNRVDVKIERLREPFMAQKSHDLLFDNVTDTQTSTLHTRHLTFDAKEAVSPITFKALGIEKPGVYRLTFTSQLDNETLTESRSILISNMGVVAKQKSTTQDGVVDVFVMDLVKNEPVGSGTVEVLAQNGTVLAQSSLSGGNVSLKLPRIQNPNMAPALVRVTRGDDVAVVGLASYTMDTPAWKAYIYPERNRFLPQDTIHAGVVLKDLGKHDGEAPLSWEITDPFGKVVHRATIDKHQAMSDVTYTLPASARLGDYRIAVMVGDTTLADTSVRVDHFVPETLSVTLNPLSTGKRLWVRPQQVTLTGQVKALSDINLGQLEGSAQFNFGEFESFTVPQHPTFTLMPPKETGSTKPHQQLPLVAQADGSFSVAMPTNALLNGHVEANIQFREPTGGASTVAHTGINVLDRDFMMAYAFGNAQMNFDWIPAKTALPISFFAFNAKGEAFEGAKVTVNLYRTWSEPVLELVNGIPQRDMRARQERVTSTTLVSGQDGMSAWTIPALADDTYRLDVEDEHGNVLWSQSLNVVEENINRLLEGTMRLVTIGMTPEKSVVKAGDPLKLNVRSPFGGLALLTLDMDHVVKHQWVSLVPGSQVITLETPNTSGHMQVSLNAVRAYDDRNTFWSNYAFDSTLVTVNPDEHKLQLKVSAPEKTFDRRIKVKLTSPEDARVQVWGVDQGILQVGQFTLPSIVNALYLDPKSYPSQHAMLDHLMSQGLVGKALGAFGGDMVKMAMAANMASPIMRKPAVSWKSEFVDLKAGVEQEVELVMPETFDGAMRVFAVAANRDKAGQADTLVALQSPVTALWSLPGMVRTGDQFTSDLLLVSDALRPNTSLTFESTPGLTMTPATRTLTLPKNTPTTQPVTMTVTGDQNVDVSFALKSPDFARTGTGFMRVLPRQTGVTVNNPAFLPKGTLSVPSTDNLIAIGTTPAAWTVDFLPMLRAMKDWSLEGRLAYITAVARAAEVDGLLKQLLPEVDNPLLEAQTLWQETLTTLKRESDTDYWSQRVTQYPGSSFQDSDISDQAWITMLDLALSPLATTLGPVSSNMLDFLVKNVRDVPSPNPDTLLRSFILMVKAGYTPYEPIYRFMNEPNTPDYAKRVAQYLLNFMEGKTTRLNMQEVLATLEPSTNLDHIRLMLSMGANTGQVLEFMKERNMKAPVDIWGLLLMSPVKVGTSVDGATIPNAKPLLKTPSLALYRVANSTTVTSPGSRFVAVKGQQPIKASKNGRISLSTPLANHTARVGDEIAVTVVFRPTPNAITLVEVPLPGAMELSARSARLGSCTDEKCSEVTTPWDAKQLAWNDSTHVYGMVLQDNNKPYRLTFKMRPTTPGTFAWPSTVLVDPMMNTVLEATPSSSLKVTESPAAQSK